MKATVKWFTVLILAATATIPPLPGQSPVSTSPKSRKNPVSPASSSAAQMQTQMQMQMKDLRGLVASQQQQLETQRQQMDQLRDQLQQLLTSTQQAQVAAQSVQGSAAQAQQTAADAERDAKQASASASDAKTAVNVVTAQTKDEHKKLAALQDIADRFRFSGDIRLRGEDFFQNGVITRNRARIRVRFGVDGVLTENFTGGFALATGTLGDPTTTNETLTNFFNRKTIGIDRGYVTYNPVGARWLSLTGGKFAYTWQRTSLTMDPDINPEGFSEKASFDLRTPLLKNFTVQGMQLLYNENAKGNDSFAIGGQVSGVVKADPWTGTPSFTLLDWRFSDGLLAASAFANQATTSGNPAIPIPGEGPGCATGFGLASVPPCAVAANGLTNATFVGLNGVRHFLSRFEYADFILNNQVKTGYARFPVNLILEYQDNLGAAAHPLDPTGNVLGSLGSQGKAYMADFSVGQAKKKGDLQAGYSFWRLEQDAIISTWAESDQRAPTNVAQNRFYLLWKPQQHVLAQYTLWIGRTLNSDLEHAVLATGVAPGQTEPDLKRQVFDLSYIF